MASNRQLSKLPPYPSCFVCGNKGLKLDFQGTDGYAEAELIAPPGFEGYEGWLHGGITATLLDEVMAKAASTWEEEVVTARLEIRYRLPIERGERLKLKGKVVGKKGKVFLTRGEVTAEGKGIVAQAEGRYILLPGRG